MKRWLLLISTMFVLFSCIQDDEDDRIVNTPVVEAYVFAGEPINHVKISRLHSEGEALPVPVNTAQVRIIQETRVFNLLLHDSIPGLYVQNSLDSLLGESGELRLEFTVDGKTYTSTTQMPSKITNLQISNASIDLNPLMPNEVVANLSWDPVADGHGYSIFIKNIGNDAEPVQGQVHSQAGNPFFTINNASSVELKNAHFSHYGTYSIYVTSVNSEFQSLYNRNGSSNPVNAPSNISDALGVFTAFNGLAITVTVE